MWIHCMLHRILCVRFEIFASVRLLSLFVAGFLSEKLMVDFEAQGKAFWYSSIALLISIPVAIIYGFVVDNYLKSLNVVAIVTGVVMLLFGPSWPWLNKNKSKWQEDEEYFKEKRATQTQTKTVRKPKH